MSIILNLSTTMIARRYNSVLKDREFEKRFETCYSILISLKKPLETGFNHKNYYLNTVQN